MGGGQGLPSRSTATTCTKASYQIIQNHAARSRRSGLVDASAPVPCLPPRHAAHTHTASNASTSALCAFSFCRWSQVYMENFLREHYQCSVVEASHALGDPDLVAAVQDVMQNETDWQAR